MSLSISTPTGSHRSSVNSYSQTRGKSANNTSSAENKLLSSHLLRAVPTETSATHVMSGKDRGAPPSNLWTGLYATYEKYPYFGRYDHDDWVAVIKAAMSGLGQSPLSIFDEVKDTGNGYNITMKDDFKLHISNDELALATHHAKFAGDDEGMLKDARFIFAIMNKRKHLEAQYNYRKIDYRTHIHQHSFGAVLSSSDYGISGYEGLKLLGLDYQLQHVWSQDVGNQVAVPAMKVFSSKRGMINDGFMENYGHKKKVPQWIESFIVLKAPHTSMPTPIAVPQISTPSTFTLEPLPPEGDVQADHELPELSAKRNGQKPDNLVTGFYTQRPFVFQGETSTHADVIKLLMSKFGQSPTDVFSNVKFAHNAYQVTFRDGFELTLSRDELEQAQQHSLFIGHDDGMIKDANFIFAAYIKRQQLQPPVRSFGQSFEAALIGNIDGRTVKNVLEGMGVSSSIKYMERAGDADGLTVLIGSNAGGLFYNGRLIKEGKNLPGDEKVHTHGYQLA